MVKAAGTLGHYMKSAVHCVDGVIDLLVGIRSDEQSVKVFVVYHILIAGVGFDIGTVSLVEYGGHVGGPAFGYIGKGYKFRLGMHCVAIKQHLSARTYSEISYTYLFHLFYLISDVYYTEITAFPLNGRFLRVQLSYRINMMTKTGQRRFFIFFGEYCGRGQCQFLLRY